MEELIKYFEDIEARLAALEAAKQDYEKAEPEQDARLAALTTQVAALCAKNVALEATIAELKQTIAELQERPLAAAHDMAAAEPVAVTSTLAESEEIAIDEETGQPELEVEFVDEEPEAAPAATDPLLDAEIISEPEPVVEAPVEEKAVAEEAAPVEEKAPVAAAAPATTTIADAAQRGETLSSIVPKLEDIRKGISLSDRFLFQRELFGGNGELMNKTIEKINGLSSLAEAEQYIAQFGWDKESNAYELFSNLLKRRW